LALIAGLFVPLPSAADEKAPAPRVIAPPTPAGITLPKSGETPEDSKPTVPPAPAAPAASSAVTRSMPLPKSGAPESVPAPAELPKGLRASTRSMTGEALRGESPAAQPVQADSPSAAPESKPAKESGSAAASKAPAGEAGSAPNVKPDMAPVDLKPAQADARASASIELKPGAILELRRATFAEVLATQTKSRTAYRLIENPRVIVLDMPDIRDQGLMFGRLVLFIERNNAPKTRLMLIPEVQGWLKQTKSTLESLTVGNNLRASEFARFFNTARFQAEALTSEERQLYDWLLAWNVLREDPNGVTAAVPDQVVISFPQASSIAGCNNCSVTQSQRQAIATHELSHAKLATDLPYQHYCEWFWSQGLPPALREKFTRFLASRGYDPNNRELLANEAQAFLMHTPDPSMFNAQLLGITDAELTAMRNLFESGLPPRPLATASPGYRF